MCKLHLLAPPGLDHRHNLRQASIEERAEGRFANEKLHPDHDPEQIVKTPPHHCRDHNWRTCRSKFANEKLHQGPRPRLLTEQIAKKLLQLSMSPCIYYHPRGYYQISRYPNKNHQNLSPRWRPQTAVHLGASRKPRVQCSKMHCKPILHCTG